MNQKILVVVFGLMALTIAFKVSHEGTSGFYKFDEASKNNMCSINDECDGARWCSNGKC